MPSINCTWCSALHCMPALFPVGICLALLHYPLVLWLPLALLFIQSPLWSIVQKVKKCDIGSTSKSFIKKHKTVLNVSGRSPGFNQPMWRLGRPEPGSLGHLLCWRRSVQLPSSFEAQEGNVCLSFVLTLMWVPLWAEPGKASGHAVPTAKNMKANPMPQFGIS